MLSRGGRKKVMKQTTLYLPYTYIRDLDTLVPEFYPSRAEAIRVAIRDLLKREVWRVKEDE